MEILNFYSFEIFEENDKKYIYVNNTNGLFEIDNVTLELLKQNGKSINEAYENIKNMISYDDFNKTIHHFTTIINSAPFVGQDISRFL